MKETDWQIVKTERIDFTKKGDSNETQLIVYKQLLQAKMGILTNKGKSETKNGKR